MVDRRPITLPPMFPNIVVVGIVNTWVDRSLVGNTLNANRMKSQFLRCFTDWVRVLCDAYSGSVCKGCHSKLFRNTFKKTMMRSPVTDRRCAQKDLGSIFVCADYGAWFSATSSLEERTGHGQWLVETKDRVERAIVACSWRNCLSR